MTTIIALLCLSVVQILGFVGLCWFLRLYFERKQAEVEAKIDATIHAWVDPGPDGQPSQFAKVSAAVGEVVGRSAAQSIMASLASEQSKVARVANGLTDELQGAQNPLLGLLTGGRRGKGAAVARLAEVLMPMLSGRHTTQGGGDHDSNTKSFSL